jgi:hypothetical protein
MNKKRIDIMLLPDAYEWAKNFSGSMSTLDFIREHTNSTIAAAFARLCWPEFIEIKGCILLEWVYDEKMFSDWWTHFNGDTKAIESVMNHMHLWDIFKEDRNGDEAILEVGSVLERTWTAALHSAYPEKKFRVEFINDDLEYGPTLSFASE